jgi:hypothetical protein
MGLLSKFMKLNNEGVCFFAGLSSTSFKESRGYARNTFVPIYQL